MTVTFVYDCGYGEIGEVNCEVETNGTDFRMVYHDLTNQDGGELPEWMTREITEKAIELAIDQAAHEERTSLPCDGWIDA
jgi:hypothetical protein